MSQVLAYHLGENELAIDSEIELDIREAPLRELLLRVPKGYAIARLNASGLSDYFPREPEDQPDSTSCAWCMASRSPGRQVVQLRLERNQPLGEATWALPRIEVAKAKSVRGHVAVAADAGFRLTAERTQGLTEIATAFFPRKVPGIQAAFRLSDPAWQATLRVERLPQTVQADALHLFSIGEGIAYGSSVMNYVVSGAPVSAFKVELSGRIFQRRVHRQGHPQLAEDGRRLRGATAHAGLGRLHACWRLTSGPSRRRARRSRSPARARSTRNPSRATRSSSAPTSSR